MAENAGWQGANCFLLGQTPFQKSLVCRKANRKRQKLSPLWNIAENLPTVSSPLNYRIYSKYSETATPYHTCSKIWTSTTYYPMLCLKIAGWAANRIDPDETPRSVASHLGLHCLLKPVCSNICGKYGSWKQFWLQQKVVLRLYDVQRTKSALIPYTNKR